jgi:hypothetical protein
MPNAPDLSSRIMKVTKKSAKATESAPQEETPKAKGRANKKVADAKIAGAPVVSSVVGKEKTAYLTTRILERAARKAFREAAKSSMERMGYVVVAQDGWIIRLFKDGRIEQIEQIQKLNIPFVLD